MNRMRPMSPQAKNGKPLKFPDGFLWGTATSPTQIEGHIDNEWTDFIARDGGNCRVACDNYHRYAEDIEWMSKLGVNSYRFGIEWSRLQSAPFAPLNQAELARYVDLLDRLHAAGIMPMVVLHHFSNPPWINAAGGWTNSRTIPAFVDYVGKLVAALKDRVHLWNTFNEPDTYACLAYVMGGYPPQRKWKLGQFRRVIDHMARAHEQASHIIQREGAARPQAGSRHRQELDFFPRLQKIFPVGPADGLCLPLHVQQICAQRLSRRPAAKRLHVHRAELLWPRAVPSFSRDDSRQRRAGKAIEGFRLRLR